MKETKPARRVEIAVEIDAPLAAVWKALTEAAELTRWFPLEARVTAGAGGSVWMSWGEPWVGEGKIEVWEPNHHLRTVEPPPKPESLPIAVDYHLESRGGKTLLRLVHSFGTGADWEDEYYDSTSRGWRFTLANLRHSLERHPGTPRPVAWPRLRLALAAEETWRRLMSSEGLLRHGTLDTARPGSRYAIGTVTGDRFEGEVRFFDPPRSFCATVENLNDSLLWLYLEKVGQEYEIWLWLWLSAYGLPQSELDAFRDRWVSALQQLFPEGRIP
jgi:uncharacterized protein YndB with AHSA1/START domain